MESDSHRQAVQDGAERLNHVDFNILKDLQHLDLSGCEFVVEEGSVGGGAYADIFRGWSTLPSRGKVKVALKHLRFHRKEDITKIFEKEIYVWQKLRHKNILPLLGYTFASQTKYPILVSDWMENGSAWEFVQSNPKCNLMRLVTGIANGLAYLHGRDIVHSDIKSENVLVTDSQDAVICDFGFTRMLVASRTIMQLSINAKGTGPYIAHEMFAYPDKYTTHSTATDVWAFGMTVYELLARERPYKHLPPIQVPVAIWKLDLPRLPDADPPLTSSEAGRVLWDVCQRCWVPSPDERASMASIVEDLPSYDGVSEAGQESQMTEIPTVVPFLNNEEIPFGSTEFPSSILSASDDESSRTSHNEEVWLGPFRDELRRNQEARFSELLQQYESEYQRADQRLDARYPGRERSSDSTYKAAKEKFDRSLEAQKRKIRHLLDEEERVLIEKERGMRKLSLRGQVDSSEAAEFIRVQEELLRIYQVQAQHPTSEDTIRAEPTSVTSGSAPYSIWIPPALFMSSQRSNATRASSISQDRRESNATPQSTNPMEDFFPKRVQNQSRNARYTAWEPDTTFHSSSGIHEVKEELSNTGLGNDYKNDTDDEEGREDNGCLRQSASPILSFPGRSSSTSLAANINFTPMRRSQKFTLRTSSARAPDAGPSPSGAGAGAGTSAGMGLSGHSRPSESEWRRRRE